MGTVKQLRGLLSLLLAGALLFSCGAVAVRADTEPTKATLSTESPETQPRETEETTQPTEQTLPAAEETVPVTVPETLPGETIPAETALQETVPEETFPEETVPEETAEPEQQTISISRAKALEAGTGGISLQGTVVFSGYGITVLQDFTDGICLELPEGDSVSVGQVLRITGSRTGKGIAVEVCQSIGAADLPQEEAVIGAIPECRRVAVRNAAFSDGLLMQGMNSVPLTPMNPQGIVPGDRVDAWGVLVDGCFYAETVVKVQPPIPVVTATPEDGVLDAGETIALSCNVPGASIYYAYSYDGAFYTDYALYAGMIPVDTGTANIYLRVYGKTPDGTEGNRKVFYFARTGQTVAQTTTTTTGGGGSSGWKLYFGQLHAHTTLFGDGLTAADAFSRAKEAGLDFFAVTEHSDAFDGAEQGNINTDGSFSQTWKAGRQAAANATRSGAFVALYGYEMSWPRMKELGHFSTFGTAGWQSDTQPGFSELEHYYKALKSAPGSISQFNHPKDPGQSPADTEAYGNFLDFAYYDGAYDDCVALLEVVSGEDKAYEAYDDALTAGWHVAPANNQGSLDGEITQGRTVILAKSLTEQSLFEAIRNHRVYATEDSNLEIRYYLNGEMMGSTLRKPAQTATVTLYDPDGIENTKVELITKNGQPVAEKSAVENGKTFELPVPAGNTEQCTYYYLRVTKPDGKVAVTAPVWVDLRPAVEIVDFRADSLAPMQGQEVKLTLSLTNRSSEAFRIEKMELEVDTLGYPKGSETISPESPGILAAGSTDRREIALKLSSIGRVDIRLKITGSLGGETLLLEKSLSLQYQIDKNQYTIQEIARVRQGTPGQIYRVKGHVTAGTANVYNTFPGMLYLQEETGGIAVTAFSQPDIAVGTPMDLIGCLTEFEGDLALEMLCYEVLPEREKRYVPEAVTNAEARDWDTRGGRLVQVEGQVLSHTNSNGEISRFTVKDTGGTLMEVRIDGAILSGTYGVNRLSAQVIPGGSARAIGIVHREADGTVVVRVRNCDEVTHVAARPGISGTADRTNPRTGNAQFRAPIGAGIPTQLLLAVLCISAMGLGALYRLRKGRKPTK